MTYGGLFEGIGGFALAAQWAGLTPVWSNEIDRYCCQVLRKNFQHEIIEADIRTIGKERKYQIKPVDVICGGFPCQPFSTAGKRKGQADDRYLWPEMLRIISEVRPKFVVGENVTGILSMDNGKVFEQICTSLEDEGYTVQTFNIPAIAQGAPHRRERIWIVAHSASKSRRQETQVGLAMDGNILEETGRHKSTDGCEACNRTDITNATQPNDWQSIGDQEERQKSKFGNSAEPGTIAYSTCGGRCEGTRWSEWSHEDIRQSYQVTPNANGQGLQSAICGQLGSIPKKVFTPLGCELGGRIATTQQWQSHWYEVATSLCRMDDGVPTWVDSHRTRRLKALGNAIVPHVAYQILKTIKSLS